VSVRRGIPSTLAFGNVAIFVRLCAVATCPVATNGPRSRMGSPVCGAPLPAIEPGHAHQIYNPQAAVCGRRAPDRCAIAGCAMHPGPCRTALSGHVTAGDDARDGAGEDECDQNKPFHGNLSITVVPQLVSWLQHKKGGRVAAGQRNIAGGNAFVMWRVSLVSSPQARASSTEVCYAHCTHLRPLQERHA
jgi:hypothetical protein